ncbi:MAG: isoprenylcysteine carboxylmethyltransferase family protein [Bacteroidia bacterium]|nr:isoprenylcysteine carboxylmethyltransferase family protein [Bacteroidia bacterium]
MWNTLRHLAGFALGIAIFILAIPFGLVELSKVDQLIFKFTLIDLSKIRLIVSVLLFILGISFMIWSNIFLLRIGKGGPADLFNVSISPQTKKLVVIGPYRYSRNPMVFGVFTLYLSIALFLNSIIDMIVILAFIFIVAQYLRFYEEKRLHKDFGDEYLEYKKSVSMIFPRGRKRN